MTLKRNEHQEKAASFFAELKDKFQVAKDEEGVEAICYDYQQNMPLPITTSTDVFYKRQLWVHNFEIASAKDPRTHCFMYPESVAKKTY